MNAENFPAARLLSIDELDRDIDDNFSELSDVINNPSAEGLLITSESSVGNSLPP
jgi:hypothetical protein